jgi:hypothetical protein
MKKQYFLILLGSSFALFGAENDNCHKHTQEITRLKEEHALEIALWEKKVAAMIAEREQMAALKAEREAASIHCQQPVSAYSSGLMWKEAKKSSQNNKSKK